MFRTLRNFWSDWGGGIGIFALILAAVGSTWAMHYSQTHSVINVGEGIEVRVAGRCWYEARIPETGCTHQFYASNELGFSDMSMEPHFTLVNTTSEPREVRVHSMSAWETPVAGNVHLEPGQKFQFQLHGKHKHWYCWIHPKKVIKSA